MPSVARLIVKTGRHTGATEALDAKASVLGSSLDSDIVLTDSSVASAHVRLLPTERGLDVEAIGGDVVSPKETIAQGNHALLRYPAEISLGDVQIEVVGMAGASSLSIPQRAMVIGAAVGFVFFLGARAYLNEPVQRVQSAASAPVSEGTGPDSQSGRQSVAEAKAAVEAFGEHLQSMGLQSILLTSRPGTVLASGTLEPERKDDWQAAQMWFDGKYGPRLSVQADVVFASRKMAKAPIAIQSVWAGQFPYVIDGDGNKFFEGAKLKDGWRLDKIEDGRILIKRDQDTLSVKF